MDRDRFWTGQSVAGWWASELQERDERRAIMSQEKTQIAPGEEARVAWSVREQMPVEGMFAGHEWRTSPAPFALGATLAREIDQLGRVLLQFYRAVNLLYRQSVEGRKPAWIAQWLDAGKPPGIIELQRTAAFKAALPQVIRPDLLITAEGLKVTELDSIPGGIGLTGWLNKVYSELGVEVIGGPSGMIDGFRSIFSGAPRTHIVVSEEAATYRPEMQWMAQQIGPAFAVREPGFKEVADGEAVYRFFEMFDLANVPAAAHLFDLAAAGRIHVTPPPKAFLEEKMHFALLWNRNLREFWHKQLGARFFEKMLQLVPYTWLVDPSPLPPQAAIPELNLTDWRQLSSLSQKQRDLILKVSGYSAHAWGARGVFLGSDLSQGEWAAAVEDALRDFGRSPRVLQRYHAPKLVQTTWFDFQKQELVDFQGRARLCPYYFVAGQGDAARATLGGVLATIVPANKKIVHGMTEAVFAPCSASGAPL
jgi:hypothetical protein